MYNASVKPEIAIAQLSIVDGAWQESPDNVALFAEASLFEGSLERGSLCIVAEVTGDPDGRDALARELVETARREYAASRGSIMLGLAQAVRAANDFFYNYNANTPREARRIAGMTAAVLRDEEIFIAQAGPGVTCHIRGTHLERLPQISHWFDTDENALAEWLNRHNFETPGAVPMGMRRSYNPDQFHVTLQAGDIVLFATRTLPQLLTDQELVDTVAHHHPDEIVTALEDLAGTTDLSVLALDIAPLSVTTAPTQIAIPAAPTSPAPIENLAEPDPGFDQDLDIILPPPPIAPPPELFKPFTPEPDTAESSVDEIEPPEIGSPELVSVPAPPEPNEEALALERARAERDAERQRIAEEQAHARQAQWRAGFFTAIAGATAALAGFFERIDWTGLGKSADRAISNALSLVFRGVAFIVRTITPGDPQTTTARAAVPKTQTAWQLAALGFPIILIILGTGMFFSYRAETQRKQESDVAAFLESSKAALKNAKQLAPTDKPAAKEAAQSALNAALAAQNLRPTNSQVNTAFNDAADFLDSLNGITALQFVPSFATFADANAKLTRIVTRGNDIFILDRGTQRIYRYTINDTGTTITPTPAPDGMILKSGDTIGGRTVGELIELVALESGKVVALDRAGTFLLYDPAKDPPKSGWSAKLATDPAAWARVNLAASYVGNLYLVDAPRNQILKYVALTEAAWTSSVTFFAPNTAPDLSNVVDLAIDGDVWLLRNDNSIVRSSGGKSNDFTIKELDQPLGKTIGIYTTPQMSALYLADAGNQRIAQVDKTTAKFTRQLKPSTQNRDTFKSLKAFTVDTQNNRLFFINGNQAYMANIPPQ